jgi:dipeptidyl aminopeptidase/acylaminoacyl peptidase
MTESLTPHRLVTALRSGSNPIVAPDSSCIVYSLAEVDPATWQNRSQLWAMDMDGGNPRQLTTEGQTNGGQVWSPDGSSIAWVSKREGDKPHAIVVLSLKTNSQQEVVRHGAAPANLAWSPDGSTIAYALPVDPDNPDETPVDSNAAPKVRAFRRLDYKQDNRGLLYDTRYQVMLANVHTGARRQVTTEPVDHTDPQWAPDGATIAAKVLTANGMRSQLAIIDVERGDSSLVGSATGSVGTFRWSRDGSFILFDGSDDHTPQNDYFRYDVATGERKQLTDDLAFSPEVGYPTLGSPAQPAWISDTIALVHGVQAGASGLWTIDATTGAIEGRLRFEAVHTGLSTDASVTCVVQGRSTPLTTGEIALTDLVAGTSTVVLDPNAAILGETPVGSFTKGSIERDGETIDFWTVYPPGFDPARTYPVVLDIHGGPHGNFGYGFDKVAATLAGAGYVVVMPNPRGSGTYGRHFAHMVRGDWGGGDWADLEAVLDQVLTEPWADPERTAIMGYSYGGFMTSWALGHTNRFKAAVCGAPVFDLESFYGTSDIGHVWSAYQWGGGLPDHRDWMLEHSPATHITNATTPTLIVHGEQDHRCPIGQGEQLFVALSQLGVETEFVRYPGGSHLMFHSGPNEHKADYYQRVIDWFHGRV